MKRCGNGRFHVVKTWNPRGVFVGLKVNTFHVTEGATGGVLVKKGVIKNFSKFTRKHL